MSAHDERTAAVAASGLRSPAPRPDSITGTLVEPRGAWLPQEARELFTARSRLLRQDKYLLHAPANTQRARRADWALFCTFCESRGLTCLPTQAETVVAFLEAVQTAAPLSGGRPRTMTANAGSIARRRRRDVARARGTEVERGLSGRSRGSQRSASTLERYISSIAVAHRLANLPNPTRLPVVRHALRALRETLPSPQPRSPVRRAQLLHVLARLWPDSPVPSFAGAEGVFAAARPPSGQPPLSGQQPRGRLRVGWRGAGAPAAQLWDLRARALLTTLYSTMARRSELMELRYEELPPGEMEGVVPIQARKSGQREHRYVDALALSSLKGWCAAAGIGRGAVFRRLDPQGRVMPQTMSAQQVLQILRAVVAHARRTANSESGHTDERSIGALQPQDIGGHSTRIGAAHDLVAAGQDLLAIMHSGGWRDAKMPRRYIQELRSHESGMARMLRSLEGIATDATAISRTRVRGKSKRTARPSSVSTPTAVAGRHVRGRQGRRSAPRAGGRKRP